jgi:hypothetical protein
VVEDQHPANFLFLHVLCDFLNIIVLVAVEDSLGHDFSNWSKPRIATLSDRSNGDVSIGYSSSEPIIVADRQEPDVLITHFVGGFCDRRVRIDALDISAHNLVHFHDEPPLLFAAAGVTRPHFSEEETRLQHDTFHST